MVILRLNLEEMISQVICTLCGSLVFHQVHQWAATGREARTETNLRWYHPGSAGHYEHATVETNSLCCCLFAYRSSGKTGAISDCLRLCSGLPTILKTHNHPSAHLFIYFFINDQNTQNTLSVMKTNHYDTLTPGFVFFVFRRVSDNKLQCEYIPVSQC